MGVRTHTHRTGPACQSAASKLGRSRLLSHFRSLSRSRPVPCYGYDGGKFWAQQLCCRVCLCGTLIAGRASARAAGKGKVEKRCRVWQVLFFAHVPLRLFPARVDSPSTRHTEIAPPLLPDLPYPAVPYRPLRYPCARKRTTLVRI